MPTKSQPATCNGNGLTATLRLRKPWWFMPAVLVASLPMIARSILTGREPTDDETEAFASRWGRVLARHATVTVA